ITSRGLRICAAKGHGHPYVAPPECESPRHDAHQSCGLVVQHKSLSHDTGIHAKASDPDFVTEDEYGRCPRYCVPRQNPAANERCYTEKLKGIARDEVRIERLQRLRTAHEHRLFPNAHSAVENVILLLVVEELRKRKIVAPFPFAGGAVVNPNLKYAMAVNVRERLQQHIIDNTKYGGARTNSQRERQDRGSNESAVLEHGPKTEADVLNQGFNKPSRAHISAFFSHLIEAAEFQPCPTTRFFRGHASGHEIGNPLIE